MPLLFIERSQDDRQKNELRTRNAAAEACRVPRQTNNNEGCGKDLQIGAVKNHFTAGL
jgi:hypothetical protein